MNTYKNIYVTGSIAYDTIMNFPGEFKNHFHPEKLHQINISFVVDKLEKQLGGTGTNIAYNASLIFNLKFEIFNQYQILNNKYLKEKPKVKILGSLGKDGKEFINFFKKKNIDVGGIVIDKKLYTSAGSVITDKNDNQLWGFYYGASEKIPYTDFKKLNKETDLLVISANHKNSFLYFQKEAIKNNIPYLYDPGMTLTWISDRDLEEGVLNCRYLVGNDYEIAMIVKRLNKTVEEIIKNGINVITTLGEKGVRYQMKNEKFEVKSFLVKNVVDPTGAGDAWRGGFISGLALGMKNTDCLKLGNVMASFAIEKYGTVNHRPSSEEIKKRILELDH